jgi:6-phosphogluconolactonase
VIGEILTVPDEVGFAKVATVKIALGIMAVRLRGRCSVGLSGGTTPQTVYRSLWDEAVAASNPETAARIFEGVDFYLGDERCVPPDDPESNYGRARVSLAAIRPLHLTRIEAERADREQAARDYERDLPAALDLLVLGIGDDGHTASLFPGSPLLDERTRRVAVVERSPQPPEVARITITPPVIAAARQIVVLASGAAKAPAVARALEGEPDPKTTPAQLARRGTWIVDRAAASLLKTQSK